MIVAIGSMTQTIEEVVDALNAKGEKVGLLTAAAIIWALSWAISRRTIPSTVAWSP